jgi:hypothetical protein
MKAILCPVILSDLLQLNWLDDSTGKKLTFSPKPVKNFRPFSQWSLAARVG